MVARPGHGKSLALKGFAKRECQAIMARGTQDSECVVVVTLEETPERVALEIADWPMSFIDLIKGRYDPSLVEGLIARFPKIPLWTIQHPRVRKGKTTRKLSSDLIYEIIEAIASDYDGKRPTLICLDYLQILQGDDVPRDQQTRTAQVEAATHGAKALAQRLDCPVVAAVQSGRVADGRTPPIPEISDLQHSSAIEQDADLVLALWRPVKTHGIDAGRFITIGGKDIAVTNDLTVIRLLKQRLGIGAGTWACELDHKTLELKEIGLSNVREIPF